MHPLAFFLLINMVEAVSFLSSRITGNQVVRVLSQSRFL
jgi:hypothetical protein